MPGLPMLRRGAPRPMLTHRAHVLFLPLALVAAPTVGRAQLDTGEPPPPPGHSGAEAAGASEPSVERAPQASAQARALEPTRPKERAGTYPSPSGETGILRVASADGPQPGLVRVALGFEFFTLGDFFRTGDENTRVAGVLSLSGAPLEYLELWLNVRAVSNRNTLTSPNLLQSQGDLQFGVKGFYPFATVVSAGVDAQVTLLSGIGDSGYDFGASEGRFRALVTADFSKAEQPIPIRAHLNAGYILDNSANLLGDGEELSVSELFALGVSEFDRVTGGVGLEVPVPYVTPYLEYTIEVPINYLATPGVVVTGRALRTAQAAGEPVPEVTLARPAIQRIIPQRLTPGVRIRPPVDGLAIDVAVEIGLTPDIAVGVPAVPDYNVVTLLSYAADPFGVRPGRGGPSGPPVAVPVLVPEGRESGGRVAGVVLDKATGAPLADAIISFDGALPVATAEDGRFESKALPEGLVRMTVRKAGYSPGEAELAVTESTPSEVEVVLEREVRIGRVEGTVVDAAGAPVPGAKIRVAPAIRDTGTTGATDAQTLTAGADGRFSAKLDEGAWRLTVTTTGYLRTGRRVAVKRGETTPEVALQLTPRGDVGARVDGDRLVLPEPLLYAKGEVIPNATARRGLDLVADLLLADASLRIEVGGHTDSRGNEADNEEVSANRARAAREYLLERGVPDDQVASAGYGASRPVAPNLTRTGRERNRRIDFIVR